MSGSPEWWKSVTDLVRLVWADYLEWNGRKAEVPLKKYCSPFLTHQTPPVDPVATEKRLDSLSTLVATGPILEELTAVNLANTRIGPKVDSIIAMAAIKLDISKQTLDYEHTIPIENLIKSAEKLNNSSKSGEYISNYAEELKSTIKEIQITKEIDQNLDTMLLSPESGSKKEITNKLTTAVKNQDNSTLEEVHRAIVACRWMKSDFDKFDPRSFEELVARVYQAEGFETEIQPKGPDGGVDVFAQNQDIKKVIQVKHISKPMTAPQLDKYVSLFEYHETADEVIIISSSSFTDPAQDRVSNVSKPLKLVNGEGLCGLLTRANISIPVC